MIILNILIAYLSLYTNPNGRSYSTNGLCSEKSITASQTNEPVLKMLENKLESDCQRIDKIITILSFKAENEKCKALPEMTTYEFFSSLVKNVVGTNNVLYPVREYTDESTIRETGAVIKEICDQISADDNIYIDTSGGSRTSANMLQLLAKILEYKGFKLAGSFYSNINTVQPVIQTTNDFTDLTMLADAVNEFVHTGRSYQLSECFENETHDEIIGLIKYMDEFTDKMQLCNIADLDETLISMRRQIEKVRAIDSTDTKIVILENLLPVIENKFFKGNSDTIDYCRMIKWCLENKLVQQAVTIYIEKIPKYIFENKILICDKNYYESVKEINANGSLKKNTDAVIFYDEFMDSVSLTDKSAVTKLKTALSEKFSKRNRDFKYDYEIKKYMDVFFNIMHGSKNNFKEYMSRLSNDSGIGGTSKLEKQIADYSIEHGFNNFFKMINTLCNNEKDLAGIIGLKAEKQPTFDKKIYTASNINAKNYEHKGVSINTKTNINDLRSILFDYIYVKSIRNHINHASDEDNLTEKQKDQLERRGYNIREFTAKAISSTIWKSVERIEKAASAIKKG